MILRTLVTTSHFGVHMDFKEPLRIGFLTLLTVILVSCGGANNTIKNVTINQSTVDNDVYLHLKAALGLGNILLPNLAAPILTPGKGEVGQIQLGPDFVEVDINLSEVVPQLEASAVLPNGASLPLIKDNPVVTLPIGGSNVEVYISLANGAPALGVSIPVRELDSIGVFSAFFPAFRVDNFLVAGGIYSSANSGESGIGAFFDLNGIINLNLDSGFAGGFVGKNGRAQLLSIGSTESYQIHLETDLNSRRTQRKIDRVLYRLHRKRRTVRVD